MKRYILVLVPLAFFSGQLFGTAFVFAPTTNKVLLSADCGGLRVLTPLPPRSFYSFRLQLADDASPSEEDGDSSVKATVPQLTFNLVKAIVGAGVLGLPAGVAAYGNAPGAIIPAIALIIAIGMISAYDFGLIGRVCSLTNTTSFRQAWSKTVSEKTAWIPAFAVTFQTLGLVLAYSMILGETFSSLLAVIGVMVSPIASLLGITGFVLLPLCLLKNLSSLAPFSLLGSLGMIYTALAMAIRYFGKAYVGGGRFVSAFSTTAPSFGTVGARGALGPSVSILAAMLSTAYVAHFNAPIFYRQLKDASVPRYLKVVKGGFGMSILLYAVITSLGFLTFGGSSSGIILNNYASGDTLMGISRFAVAVSLLGSYPLVFTGARDGILDLFQIKNNYAWFQNTLTVSMLAAITGLACVTPDVTFVLSFVGATLGNSLIYVFPALMFRGAVLRFTKQGENRHLKNEAKWAMGSAGFGVFMGILGAKMALQTLAR